MSGSAKTRRERVSRRVSLPFGKADTFVGEDVRTDVAGLVGATVVVGELSPAAGDELVGDVERLVARQRVLGTLAGALLALLLVAVLPGWAVAVALFVTLGLTIVYSLVRDYPRQVAFMTPAIVLVGSAGHPELIATERTVATVLGALLAAGIALALNRFEQPEQKQP